MKKFVILKYLPVIFLLYQYIPAQIPVISVKQDTNNVLIGDQIGIDFEFIHNKKIDVVWPFIPDSFGKLEILVKGKLDTQKTGTKFLIKQHLIVTSFDAGNYTFPSFTFSYNTIGNMPEMLNSIPLILHFNTMEVDTTAEIKDIKGPLSPPVDWKSYLLYVVILIVLLIGGFFAYKYWKKRSSRQLVELDYDPDIPPHVLALEALKQLELERLWQSGQVKEYYIRLTDIVRIYMKRQFGINAMEMITAEIISAMTKYGFAFDKTDNMKTVFTTADFAKFAKYQPFPDENARCMDLSKAFINSTIPDNKTEINVEKDNNFSNKYKNSDSKTTVDFQDKLSSSNTIITGSGEVK